MCLIFSSITYYWVQLSSANQQKRKNKNKQKPKVEDSESFFTRCVVSEERHFPTWWARLINGEDN